MLLGFTEVWRSLTAEVRVQRLLSARKIWGLLGAWRRKMKTRRAMPDGSSLLFGAVIPHVDANFC